MIRDAMVYYINKIFQQINIFDALLRQDNWNKYLDTVGKQVLDRLSEKNSATMIQNILDKVQTFESVMQYYFLENKKISFIWMFILSAKRYRNGHPVEQSYRIEKSSFEYLVVKEMGLQYDLSEDEVCFLAFHLKLIRKRMAKDYYIDSTLDFCIYKFIENISLDLGYPFMKDLELMNNIKKHMYAILEPTGGLDLGNLEEILTIALDAGVRKIVPHVYSSIIDPETGATRIDDVRAIVDILERVMEGR